MKRSALRAVSVKRRAQQAGERRFKAQVRDRDLFQCQGCGATPSQARGDGLRLEVHHRLPRGRGGKDSPENGVVLCGLGNSAPGSCHWMVDHHRAEALRRGLVLHTGHDPAHVPLEDWDCRLWLLLPDGTKRPVANDEEGAA